MNETVDAMHLCRERFSSLGRSIVRLEQRKGLFAAKLFDVWLEGAEGSAERYIYKLPSQGRYGEYELFSRLGDELSPWMPEDIVRFGDHDGPKALAMRYAGEPILPQGVQEVRSIPKASRIDAYSLATEQLSELHVFTAHKANVWLQEGKATPYRYAREWADALLEEAAGVLGERTAALLVRVVYDFYSNYSAEAMQGPDVFTHGDPHGGNILRLGNRITLIDWEWTAVASPMRDIAILVQDEPDDELMMHVALGYANLLQSRGVPSEVDALMADFHRMLVDNTIMMLGWDVELYRRGDLSDEQFQRTAKFRISRIRAFWRRVQG